MARFPTGLTGPLPGPGDDPNTWGTRLALALDDQPLGLSAPCLNPECAGPVDFHPTSKGQALLYCSNTCRSRAATLRQRLLQQLDLIETALSAEHRRTRGLPRAELRGRSRHLRWWLARLAHGPEAEGQPSHGGTT